MGTIARMHLGRVIWGWAPREACKPGSQFHSHQCSLEPVSCVLVDAIPAVQVEGTDATRNAGAQGWGDQPS